jgi:hypothetical protein
MAFPFQAGAGLPMIAGMFATDQAGCARKKVCLKGMQM